MGHVVFCDRTLSVGYSAIVDEEPAALTSAGVSEKHRFGTYERDSESGNDYATNRHYANGVGRFMQPSRLEARRGASKHEPLFVSHGDPLNLTDSTGLLVGYGDDHPSPYVVDPNGYWFDFVVGQPNMYEDLRLLAPKAPIATPRTTWQTIKFVGTKVVQAIGTAFHAATKFHPDVVIVVVPPNWQCIYQRWNCYSEDP
ncbi:MAG TPA: hypothetical protein VJX67_07780 [Blastocatellia bacterium]|nr:hypothetical protein [Blastocatellia bacterium]